MQILSIYFYALKPFQGKKKKNDIHHALFDKYESNIERDFNDIVYNWSRQIGA